MLDQPLDNPRDDTCPFCGGYAAVYCGVETLLQDSLRGTERIVRLDYWFCKATCRREWTTPTEDSTP